MRTKFRFGVAVLVAGVAVLLVSPVARADEINLGTVYDLSEDGMTWDGSPLVTLACPSPEVCIVTVAARPGPDWEIISTIPAQGTILFFGEPDGIFISDRLDLNILPDESVQFLWDSSFAGQLCSDVPFGCEAGEITRADVTYRNLFSHVEHTYYLYFQSDADPEPIPEPTSLLLLGTGLLAGGRHWRTRQVKWLS